LRMGYLLTYRQMCDFRYVADISALGFCRLQGTLGLLIITVIVIFYGIL